MAEEDQTVTGGIRRFFGVQMDRYSLLETTTCMVLFTYFGALSRMALTTASTLSSAALLPEFVAPFMLANVHGSFLMGLLVAAVDRFGRTYAPIHVGLTTGYCGSCTTFSAWQKGVASAAVVGRVVDSLIASVVTFCTSYCALLFGYHIGNACFGGKSESIPDAAISGKVSGRSWTLAAVTLTMTVAVWLGVFLDPADYRRAWWVACAFGPIGTLIRYWLLLRNRNWPEFPLYTFLVNVIASVIGMSILVGFQRLQTLDNVDHKLLTQYDFWLNSGVSGGILGCLSTVSTYVNELRKLSDSNIAVAYRYGLISVVVAQVLCILIGCVKFFF